MNLPHIAKLTILAICITFAMAAPADAQSPEPLLVVPSPLEGPIADAPPDIQIAIAAIVLRLRGVTDAAEYGPVRLSDDAERGLAASAIGFPGFAVTGFHLRYVVPLPDGEPGRRIIGDLVFEDDASRRVTMQVGADYRIDGDEFEIVNASARTASPAIPDVRLLLVPAGKVPANLLKQQRDHAALLEFVSENASPSELIWLKGRADYYVFVFAMDRLAEDDGLDVFVGRRDSAERGRWQGTRRVLNYAGWRVLVLRGVLDLASPAAPAFEVFFLPGSADPRSGGPPIPVGRFALGLG